MIRDPFALPGQTEEPAPAEAAQPGPVEQAMTQIEPKGQPLPEVPEGGDLERMQTLAQQLDWPTLFIEAVPPETYRKFRALATGKTDLERLQDLIRQVEYE